MCSSQPARPQYQPGLVSCLSLTAALAAKQARARCQGGCGIARVPHLPGTSRSKHAYDRPITISLVRPATRRGPASRLASAINNRPPQGGEPWGLGGLGAPVAAAFFFSTFFFPPLCSLALSSAEAASASSSILHLGCITAHQSSSFPFPSHRRSTGLLLVTACVSC